MDKKKASKLLGVPLTASTAEIKVAYKKAALKWHPDKNTDNVTEANNKFREISNAYKILTDNTNNDTNDTNGIFSDFASKVFEEFISSMGQFNNLSEEEEINTDADEIYNFFNFIEKNAHDNMSNFPNMSNVFVFGPENLSKIDSNIKKNVNIEDNEDNEDIEDKSLHFKVRIKIEDIWKNSKKTLSVKNKYFIQLPLYYNNITFNKSKKISDDILKNVSVKIIDKCEFNFKRKDEWDLETIKSISLNDIYKDCILDILLPDETIIKVEWKKEYIHNIKNEENRGFFIYNFGLPIPHENIIDSELRGKLWVKIYIILPDKLNISEQSNELDTNELDTNELDTNELDTNELDKAPEHKYITPEFASNDEWTTDKIDRTIELDIDDYL
jgi:curved DNA-binding protein CbpA